MTRSVLLIAIFCICILANISACPNVRDSLDVSYFDTSSTDKDEVKYRLPNNTRPEVYDISLHTDVADEVFDFSGVVKIRVNVLEESNYITLHQRQLEIVSAHLSAENGNEIPLTPFTYDSVTEFLTFTTVDYKLEKGEKFWLTIEYKGELRKDGGGFHRTSYKSGDKLVWLAATQFEPVNARHAFPCYDEPALKAIFKIHIEHSPRYTAISNMPVDGTKLLDDEHTVTSFQTTPPMSTYLIAFIVSDYSYSEKKGENGFTHRVFNNPDVAKNGAYAADEGEKILRMIGEYLDVQYSLPKLDHAAIASMGGAMENWGLITYGPFLAFDPEKDSDERKKSITTIMSHEIGHQWFGDLVSPDWWSYLWLNEGFAHLFEHLGTDLVHPEWEIFITFLDRLRSTFKIDATNRTRPMTSYVEDPRSVQGLFDSIAYAKSGSVLRMFLNAFTENSFKKGLKYYLTARSFKGGSDLDLFEGLERAVKEDNTLPKKLNVKDIFGSWSNQKGFPLLIVKRNYLLNTMHISQERYFDTYPHPEAHLTSFWIPYNFDTRHNVDAHNTSIDGWLPKDTKSLRIKQTANKKWSRFDWVLFNKQQTGYYRVLYDQTNYKYILTELSHGDPSKIHPDSRAQLLDDTADFVRTGRSPSGLLLKMTEYLKRERDLAPWTAAEKCLMEIKNSLNKESDAYKKYKRFVADLVKPFYQDYSLNSDARDSFIANSIRLIAVKLACEFGVEACLQDVRESFDKFMKTGEFASPNTRALVYEFGIREANSSVVNSIWKQLQSTNVYGERMEILSSIGSISDESVLQEYVNKIFDPNAELSQEERTILYTSTASKSRFGLSKCIELLETEHDEQKTQIISNMVNQKGHKTLSMLANNINTQDLKEKLHSVLERLTSKNVVSKQQVEHFDYTMERAIRSHPLNWDQFEGTLMAL